MLLQLLLWFVQSSRGVPDAFVIGSTYAPESSISGIPFRINSAIALGPIIVNKRQNPVAIIKVNAAKLNGTIIRAGTKSNTV